jgi:hypothetical protein
VGVVEIEPAGTTPVKEEMLGMYDTLEDCADACRDTEGCKYFQYGIGSGKKVNFCIWKKAPNEACKDFDSEGRWMLSYKRWMWSEFTASVDFEFGIQICNQHRLLSERGCPAGMAGFMARDRDCVI